MKLEVSGRIRWRRGFGDGQLHVNLRGFVHADAPAAPAEAIPGFLNALGVAPERIPPSLDEQAWSAPLSLRAYSP